jgi:nitroreductase
MLMTPTSSVTSVESTTIKGMIQIHGADVWTIDTSLFPVRGKSSQKIKFLLRFATLAPSLYNSQPWRFLVKDDQVAIYADRDRSLVAADPYDRALLLSFGAVIQYLQLAANHYEYRGALKLFPDEANPDLIAIFGLGEPGFQADPHNEELFQAIFQSHTNKKSFTQQAVAPENFSKLVQEVEAGESSIWVEALGSLKQRKKLGRIISMAIDVQSLDKYYQEEIARFAHTHVSEDDGVQGFKPSDPGFSSFRARDGEGAHGFDEIAEGSPLLMILGSRSDAPRQIVECGIVMSRVILAATTYGISHSYLNQPMMYQRLRNRVAALVEGVEDLESDEQLAQITNVFPQVVLRLGYGEPVETFTHRRSVKSMLIKKPIVYAKP